jgi:endogenous inhibitor of DNA gyrase (YacG/DUF329 family)
MKDYITVSCSACDKPLIDFYIIKKDLNIKGTYSANCPFCGDKAYPITLHNKLSPIECAGVEILDMVNNGSKINFHLGKV